MTVTEKSALKNKNFKKFRRLLGFLGEKKSGDKSTGILKQVYRNNLTIFIATEC